MVFSASGFGDRASGQLKIELPSRSIQGHRRILAQTGGDMPHTRCRIRGGQSMRDRRLLAFITFALMLGLTIAEAQAWDDSKYPDLKGQWRRTELGDPTRFDPSKPAGLGQQAPLTPEYQARFEAALKDLAAGGPGLEPSYACIPPGMPRIMNVYSPMEIVATPDHTHI